MDKRFFSIVCLLGIFVLIGAGCSQSAVVRDSTNSISPKAEDGAKKPESEQPLPKTTSSVSEAQCIDVLAHRLWAAQLQTARGLEASVSMVKKAEDLQKQYRISDDDFENICNAEMGDVDFVDKIQKRMQDLGFTIK